MDTGKAMETLISFLKNLDTTKIIELSMTQSRGVTRKDNKITPEGPMLCEIAIKMHNEL